ncbi:hypothetical protein FQZ97_1089930 [compost metagenome]
MAEDLDGQQAAVGANRQQQADRAFIAFGGGGQQNRHRNPFARGQPGGRRWRAAQQLAGRQGNGPGQRVVVVAAGGKQVEQGALIGGLAPGLDTSGQQLVGGDQQRQAEAGEQGQDRQCAALHGGVSWPRMARRSSVGTSRFISSTAKATPSA